MGERKVLNKYYPPDFDPSKIPRIRRKRNQQINVRSMLSMSIRCNTCGGFIYKGTKFNFRKEDVMGEKYLGIQIFRFYFKCTHCSAELTLKTDPKNSDYVVESGATRNFEPWCAEEDEEERVGDDAMKALEKRTSDSKREMDTLAALDEIKSINSRHATVCVDHMLEALQRQSASRAPAAEEEKEESLEEEDEAHVRSIFQKSVIRRISDEDVDDDNRDFQFACSQSSSKKRKLSEQVTRKPKLPPKSSSVIQIQVIKKPVEKSENESEKSSGLKSLCQNYYSDDDE